MQQQQQQQQQQPQQSKEMVIGLPKKILAKQLKQPNIVLYQVEYPNDRKQWITLENFRDSIYLLEQYETNAMQTHYNQLKPTQVVKGNLKENEVKEILMMKTSQIAKTDIFNSRRFDQEDKEYCDMESREDVNKKLKQIGRQYKQINKEYFKRGFTEDSIVKIITYARDDLDNNRFNFLVEWRQKMEKRLILPSWVSQEKLKLNAPNVFEQYVNERSIKF